MQQVCSPNVDVTALLTICKRTIFKSYHRLVIHIKKAPSFDGPLVSQKKSIDDAINLSRMHYTFKALRNAQSYCELFSYFSNILGEASRRKMVHFLPPSTSANVEVSPKSSSINSSSSSSSISANWINSEMISAIDT